MEKKGSVLVKLPMQLYVSLHDRQLNNHISYLVSRFLEEFLKAADVRISWAEMPTKAEQRRYLEQKFQEFLSGTLKGFEEPQEKISEKAKEPSLTETVPSSPEVKKEEKKEEEEVRAEDRKEIEDEELRRKRKEEFLKRYEQFW
jgi:hypothetical protein